MLTSSAPAFLHPQMNNWIPLNICIPQVCSLSMDWANSSDRLETRLWKYQSRVHCKIIIPHTNPHDVNKARQAQLLLLLQPKLSQAQEEMPASQGYRLKVQEQSPDPNSDSLHYICFLWFIRSHATLPPRDMTKKKSGWWLFYLLPAATSPPSAAASDTRSPISCIHVFLIILLWLFIYWSPMNAEGIISCNIQFGLQRHWASQFTTDVHHVAAQVPFNSRTEINICC